MANIILAIGALAILIAVIGFVIGVVSNVIKELSEGGFHTLSSILIYFAKKKNIDLLLVSQYPKSLPQEYKEAITKLNKQDKVKIDLLNYSPIVIGMPSLVDFPEIYYESFLSELERVGGLKNVARKVGSDLEELKNIANIGNVPAYKKLYEIKNFKPIEYEKRFIKKPKEPIPPIGWTEWSVPKKYSSVELPRFSGILKPLNFIYKKVYQSSITEVDNLNLEIERLSKDIIKRNDEVKMLYEKAVLEYKSATNALNMAWDEYVRHFKLEEKKYLEAFDSEVSQVKELISLAEDYTDSGLFKRIELTLKYLDLPDFVPVEFTFNYDADSRILILEHMYPDIGTMLWVKTIENKYTESVKKANIKESKEASLKLYPLITLRLACEIARLDFNNQITAVVVNGWSNYVQKSTGQKMRAYCASLFSEKDKLLALNLSDLDPIEAFNALKGISAKSLELTPIAPVLRLNKEDKRFIEPKDILDLIDENQNLASMDWEDFEHLCRELFEKAFASSGAEVKVTQASRDQGVDAVIFDPDVLRGGKIVVQAKRYTNLVDVSAVRDLYGSVINEGAIKGILVTTSNYGPDAYGFANGKPITLINGQELLGLLQNYGYNFRINIDEARRLKNQS